MAAALSTQRRSTRAEWRHSNSTCSMAEVCRIRRDTTCRMSTRDCLPAFHGRAGPDPQGQDGRLRRAFRMRRLPRQVAGQGQAAVPAHGPSGSHLRLGQPIRQRDLRDHRAPGQGWHRYRGGRSKTRTTIARRSDRFLSRQQLAELRRINPYESHKPDRCDISCES